MTQGLDLTRRDITEVVTEHGLGGRHVAEMIQQFVRLCNQSQQKDTRVAISTDYLSPDNRSMDYPVLIIMVRINVAHIYVHSQHRNVNMRT